ncbi:MAG TPA: hypothetical protein O0Y06_07630 [Methanocorpusculum sp.]|nr:hypothetical protein [Methanocorpusculum sp.]HJK80756.1 hypothetical protein [Methanocorpusculum sp.]
MRKHIYVNLTEPENETLDQILHNAGYLSRTDYFTALAKTSIYGLDITNRIQQIRQLSIAKTRREETFFTLLTELAFPVIAMKNATVAVTVLHDELRDEMYTRTGTVPTPAEMQHLARLYETLFLPELTAYRQQTETRRYLEEKE